MFSVAVSVIEPLLLPLTGFAVSHVWLLATVQLVFDVILKVAVLLLAAATLSVVAETVKTGVAPA